MEDVAKYIKLSGLGTAHRAWGMELGAWGGG
jgi:hypothetical protein